MDFGSVFSLGPSLERNALHVEPIGPLPDRESLLHGEIVPETPLEFRADSGSRPLDLVGTTTHTLRLVSARFVHELHKLGARGWQTFPVRIVDKRGAEIPNYSGLAVTGRAGPLDYSKTKVVAQTPRVSHGELTFAELGWWFDPGSWDGSEVFAPAGTTGICVTAALKESLIRSLTGLHFTPLNEMVVRRHLQPPPGRTVESISPAS